MITWFAINTITKKMMKYIHDNPLRWEEDELYNE